MPTKATTQLKYNSTLTGSNTIFQKFPNFMMRNEYPLLTWPETNLKKNKVNNNFLELKLKQNIFNCLSWFSIFIYIVRRYLIEVGFNRASFVRNVGTETILMIGNPHNSQSKR